MANTAFDSATGYGTVNANNSVGDDGSGHVQLDGSANTVSRPTVADLVGRMWPTVA